MVWRGLHYSTPRDIQGCVRGIKNRPRRGGGRCYRELKLRTNRRVATAFESLQLPMYRRGFTPGSSTAYHPSWRHSCNNQKSLFTSRGARAVERISRYLPSSCRENPAFRHSSCGSPHKDPRRPSLCSDCQPRGGRDLPTPYSSHRYRNRQNKCNTVRYLAALGCKVVEATDKHFSWP